MTTPSYRKANTPSQDSVNKMDFMLTGEVACFLQPHVSVIDSICFYRNDSERIFLKTKATKPEI